MATTWTTMTSFDDGLRTSLINFIDTKIDGTKLNKDNINGRSKVFEFEWYGIPSQNLSPGTIDTFSLILSYPPSET